MLEHIEDPSTFLSEIYRCLKRWKINYRSATNKGFKKDHDHKVFIIKILRCKLKRYNFAYKCHFYLPFPLKILVIFSLNNICILFLGKSYKVKSNKINLIFSIFYIMTELHFESFNSINSLKEDNKSNEFSINKVLILTIQRKNIQKSFIDLKS